MPFLITITGAFLMKRNDLVGSKQHLDRAVELTPNVPSSVVRTRELNLKLKNNQQRARMRRRAANIRDSKGIIIDLQLYVVARTNLHTLGNAEWRTNMRSLSQRTPVPPRKD